MGNQQVKAVSSHPLLKVFDSQWATVKVEPPTQPTQKVKPKEPDGWFRTAKTMVDSRGASEGRGGLEPNRWFG